MSAREITVSKIVLTIGKKEIVLTLDEARQLRDELDSALPRAASFYPIIYNPQPFIPMYPNPTIYCGQIAGGNTTITATY